MSEIQAIETYYNGYKFRSRLEARWAVFFDALGIKYEYEPEGFKVVGEFSDPEDPNYYEMFYLPDFYLPDFRTYVEIKHSDAIKVIFGSETVSMEDGTEKSIKYMLALRHFINSGYNYWICLGDPMESRNNLTNYLFYRGRCPLFYITKMNNDVELECEKGMCRDCKTWDLTCSIAIGIIDTMMLLAIDPEKPTFPNPDNHMFCYFPENKGYSQLTSADIVDNVMRSWLPAAKEARQARFEHGEKPVIYRRNIYETNQ